MVIGYSNRLEMYGDDFPADPESKIELLGTYNFPPQALCRDDDSLVGLVMTFDGNLAFATDQGVVGVLPRDIRTATDASLHTTSLNGDKCDDPNLPADALTHITNNIAADPEGGIYAVTAREMLRFSTDGANGVRIDWRSEYENGEGLSAIRIGDAGSGSTPTVMGTGDDDRFVVITDGQAVMHLVLYWRDTIPADWQPIAPGKDPRIACEFPVTFGRPEATNTESEQSVLVSGYSSVLTQNRLEDTAELATLAEAARRGSAAFLGGDPALAPRGAQRIDWDPATRTCSSVWSNATISMPNTVPTMSRATQLIYGVGIDDAGTWGLHALDFATGEPRFFVRGPGGEGCAEQQLAQFQEGAAAVFRPYYTRYPTSCDNSFYGSTTIGPDRTIYISNFGSLTRYVPD